MSTCSGPREPKGADVAVSSSKSPYLAIFFGSVVAALSAGNALAMQETIAQADAPGLPDESKWKSSHNYDAVPGKRATLRPIPREHDISFGDFKEKYLATSMPVIISGAMGAWEAAPLSSRGVDEICGERPLRDACEPDAGHVKFKTTARSNDWGSLATLPPNDAILANFSQLLAAQADESWYVDLEAGGERHHIAGSDLYLHDAPLEIYCPALLAKLRAPKCARRLSHSPRWRGHHLAPSRAFTRALRYFPVDFRQQMGPQADNGDAPCSSSRRHAHPSLFLGPARTQSGLHRDSMATRFWMGVLQGTKTFRITDQVDSLVLKSRRPTSCDQTVSEILEGAGRSHKPSLANEVRVTALNRPQPL